MSKLSVLEQLPTGWSGPGSLPLNSKSADHYKTFLMSVGPDRFEDAEPVLTDEGFIRLEWDAEGYSYSAEIGADSLYMCALAPNPDDDDDVELDYYDGSRLQSFFHSGKLR